MLSHIVFFILGLGILYLGADWLIDGASEVAKKFGIRPLIIGLTIVALGTSIPEFLLNLFAVAAGEDGLAIGNIIGSNIANIALILGISAVLMPLSFGGSVLKKEYPIMLAVTGLFYLLSVDGVISRMDGGILMGGLVAFLIFVIHDASHSPSTSASEPEEDPLFAPHTGLKKWLHDEKMGPFVRILLIVAGMAALAIGARLMVDSSIAIAEYLGISPLVIGLTIVAIGTSLPELAASLMASYKNESDLSVGNILGSNLLNILFVIGLVALIQPMQVEEESLRFHMPAMVAFSLLLWPLARRRGQLSRLGGVILLTGFAAYLLWLTIQAL
ncbi:MAG: calcium/sodium antiporter [Bacteroidetes bacterium]|nr:calcium/sodium antiporter [Bacteroidota bacterium]MDA0873723.1 calcium/sodium antiporter [Bacteroidota bacterium]